MSAKKKGGIIIFLLIIVFASIISVAAGINYTISSVQSSLAQKVLRLHILANSDTAEDQALKLAVKTRVVDFLNEWEQAQTGQIGREELISYINDHSDEIKKEADSVIYASGYDYEVTVSLEITDFPDKMYGQYTFPAGEYLALNINIGQAEGKNWWCVLYPPLCFVDMTQGILPEESQEILATSLDEQENDVITGSGLQIRFKLLELLGIS